MPFPTNYQEQALYKLVKEEAVVVDFLENTLLDGLWLADSQQPANGWVSRGLWESLGYSAEQYSTNYDHWHQLFNPEDLSAAYEQINYCLNNPTALPYTQALCFRHLNGSTVRMRCQGLPLPNTGDTPTRMLIGLRIVTEQRQEESQTYEMMDHYHALLNSQSVYIIKTDVQGLYTYANDYFYTQFGLTSAIIGTLSSDTIYEEDRPKCLEVVRNCFAVPEVSHQVVLRKPYPDGTTRSNHWEFKGVCDATGKVHEIMCVGYDNTLLVENLIKSQHLLDITSQQNLRLQNFAYITSHNIRSHSANLTSLVQLLEEADSPQKHALFLQMLRTSTEKLAETIVNLNDIVAMHRDVNKPRQRRQLKAEIERTLESLSALIQQHHIAVQVNVPADVHVTVVPAYLDSILLNLISNAVKYRNPHRQAQIIVSTRQEPGYILLSVQDNGLGLDLAKNQSKLFGMYRTFHQNEDARGIGLFITKNQIEAMQGQITVESEVGVGTTFTVYFYEKN